MKPLIFAFRESCDTEQPELTMIEYSDQLNLNVNKITRAVAIEEVSNLATETLTKSQGESSDTDYSSTVMSTETRTFTKSESTDTDVNRISLAEMLITETGTRMHRETSDSDR